jgi:hypothetical protein
MTGSAISEWAPVASAAAAALAAIASWLSVRQSRLAWREEHTPRLECQAVVDPQTRRISLLVQNTGGGLARDVVCMLAEGQDLLVAQVPPYGMLKSGEAVEIATPLLKQGALSGPMIGALICQDSGGTTHAWSASGVNYKSWSRRRLRRRGIENFDAFRAVVPDVDPRSLNVVPAIGAKVVS